MRCLTEHVARVTDGVDEGVEVACGLERTRGGREPGHYCRAGPPPTLQVAPIAHSEFDRSMPRFAVRGSLIALAAGVFALTPGHTASGQTALLPQASAAATQTDPLHQAGRNVTISLL